MVLTTPWLSPVSFAPNMFRNMVKLMGPEASLSMASSSSSLMLVLPVADTRQGQECHTSPGCPVVGVSAVPTGCPPPSFKVGEARRREVSQWGDTWPRCCGPGLHISRTPNPGEMGS